MSIFHDSASPRHCRPLGAAVCGRPIYLALHAPEAEADGGELVLHGDEGFDRRYPLQRQGDMLFAAFQGPELPRVVWYHFYLNTPTGTIFCGAAENGIDSRMFTEWPSSFQLTVYDPAFETPDWFRQGIMYQIFPDRFARDDSDTAARGLEAHRQKGRRPRFHEDWTEPVCWQPEPGEKDYIPNDYYGGTLRGIGEKLPELAEMGVSVLYLNPIFEADSNHRYNTADYLTIDPVLGTQEDFRQLCQGARKLNIRLILDGVFSHTGSDSVYFNREARYPGPGAYQGSASPYYSWYDFRDFPHDYRAWWGFPTLPEVKEEDPDWQAFIFGKEDSVVRYWLREGASGWRLDVADELPDQVLRGIYAAAKAEKPDCVIIGEVWEDATTKCSYGSRRQYALGDALDSVMNYPFRRGVIDFVRGKTDAFALRDLLLSQRLHYPRPMYAALMNLLSSHDVPRLRTALTADASIFDRPREEQVKLCLTPQEQTEAGKLQALCAVLQFAMPGVPCIYYGDEWGMEGASDPFDRAPLNKKDSSMQALYTRLGKLRHSSDVLKKGGVGFWAADEKVLCILRVLDEEVCLCAVNLSGETRALEADLPGPFRGLELWEQKQLAGKTLSLQVPPRGWSIYLQDKMISSKEIPI